MSSNKYQSKTSVNPSLNGEMDEELMAMKRLQLRRVLRSLDEIKGVGTSLISLLIPPTGSLQRVSTKLHDEYALSDQIQSRV
jgi:peptide subunit release factor 1 (eRF1)